MTKRETVAKLLEYFTWNAFSSEGDALRDICDEDKSPIEIEEIQAIHDQMVREDLYSSFEGKFWALIDTLADECTQRVGQEIPKKEPEPDCDCSMYHSAGDMGPCMWDCPKHGITGFIVEMNIIEHYVRTADMDYAEAKRFAFDLLKQKQKEFTDKGDVYFDEDHFSKDLTEAFEDVKYKPEQGSKATARAMRPSKQSSEVVYAWTKRITKFFNK